MNWELIQDILVIALNSTAMLAMGLALPVSQVSQSVKNYGPLISGLLVNLLLAPAVALGIASVLDFSAAAALGLLLCAAAPGGNTGPLLSSNAKGNIAYSVTLVIILSFASLLTIPLYLGLHGARTGPDIPVLQILKLTELFHIAPLVSGMLIHHFAEQRAKKASAIFRAIANICLVLLTVLLLSLKGQALIENGWKPVLAMAVFVGVLLASGFLAGSARGAIKALSMTTATRNLSLALLLGAQVFPEPSTMMTILTYGLLWVTVTVPLSFWLGSRKPQ